MTPESDVRATSLWTHAEGRHVEEQMRLADLDAELGLLLSAPQLEAARRVVLVSVMSLQRGAWNPHVHQDAAVGGFLVLDGCLTREVSLMGAVQAIDFLAQGDPLRPSDEQPLVSVPSDITWTVLAPTRLAVLDQDFLRSIQPWPALVTELLRRHERRADWLAHVLAISHLPRVETRVLVLLWLFADRWGRRRGDEVAVPVPLTHVNIARLVGARRPTVTAVLQGLVEAGHIASRSSGHWVLRGEPPSSTRSASASKPEPGP